MSKYGHSEQNTYFMHLYVYTRRAFRYFRYYRGLAFYSLLQKNVQTHNHQYYNFKLDFYMFF